MLEKGIKGSITIVTEEKHSAKIIGSGDLMVFGTPAMIALMEETAYKSVSDFIGETNSSVGTSLDVKHVSATRIGMKVTADSELIEVDGKRLVFTIKAFDEKGLIGEGRHERFIVDKEKFMQRTSNK